MRPPSAAIEAGAKPPGASRTPALARAALVALLLVYVGLCVSLMPQKGRTFDETRIFSMDEYNQCAKIYFLLSHHWPWDVGDGRLYGCNPEPYGQLYILLVAGPLAAFRVLAPLKTTLLFDWAVVVLVLSGCASLVLLYRLGARLYGPLYGVLAAVALAANPDFFRFSTEIHPDLPQLLFMIAGFYFCVRVYERCASPTANAWWDTALAAAFAGAAMATKLNGLFLLPVIFVAYNRAILAQLSRHGWLAALRRNLAHGFLALGVFLAVFFACNPCWTLNPSLLWARTDKLATQAASNAADLTPPVGAPVGGALRATLGNLAFSSWTLAGDVLGYGIYVVCLAGVCLGAWTWLRRDREEMASGGHLSDVFVIVFLGYLLLVGQVLFAGRLLPGYGRYVLPALPFLLLSALRAVRTVAEARIPLLVKMIPAAAVIVLQTQSVRATSDVYLSRLHQREAGSFKIGAWVEQNIPPGSTIYTEAYVRMPESGYVIVGDYAVSSLEKMRAADYVVTKTLANDLYADPVRWEEYKLVRPQIIQAREIYGLLDAGALPEFRKLVELSQGSSRGGDTVVVYQNLIPREKRPQVAK